MKQITFTINKKEHQYLISVGQNLLEKVPEIVDLSRYSSIFVITDEVIAKYFLPKLLEQLPNGTKHISVPPGEKAKNIQTLQTIWNAMKDAELDRKSLVINLGGGVIGDMGGFAASTYMRGIAFMQIPTTLLSQIDASVGGKTGIDFAGIKNLIGTFNQPIAVIIDVKTLESLPKRELISGFGEMIKHGLIADKAYFEKVTSKAPLEFSQEELIELIAQSCATKKELIEQDETESGVRKIVNFGHTVGHAIEALSLESDNPLLHGEAVSIGMIAEAKISQMQNMLSIEDFQTIENALTNAGLPTAISGLQTEDIIKKMQSDKKNFSGQINFTLLQTIGKGVINQKASEEIIKQAIAYITQ